MKTYCVSVPSPVGLLHLAADDHALLALTISGQKYEQDHLPADAVPETTPLLRSVCGWLEDYFAGRAPSAELLPLSPCGTIFQERVWAELLRVPYGTTISYGELAARLQSSPRAVGQAVGRNPISILIPCHRVVASNGGLRGYAGGMEAKAFLLRLEASSPVQK